MIDKLIPITQETLTEYNSGLWYYVNFIRGFTTIEIAYYNSNNRRLEMTLELSRRVTVFRMVNASPQIVAKWWKKFAANTLTRGNQTYYICETEGYMCFMPFEVWDVFADQVAGFQIKTRNVYTRVFLFMYMNISAFKNQWGNSIENIARELKMDHSMVSAILIWLEEHHFLERSNYASSYGISRNYFLPREIWTDARIHEEEIMKNEKLFAKSKE